MGLEDLCDGEGRRVTELGTQGVELRDRSPLLGTSNIDHPRLKTQDRSKAELREKVRLNKKTGPKRKAGPNARVRRKKKFLVKSRKLRQENRQERKHIRDTRENEGHSSRQLENTKIREIKNTVA